MMMRHLKKLFLLISVPLFIAFCLCDKTLQGFLAVLAGGTFIWIAYWFAWWLSDGFKNMFEGSDSENMYQDLLDYPNVSSGIDPYTGKVCMTIQEPWGTVHIPTR